MEKLKKLIAHFRGYQKQAGKDHEVQVDIKSIPIIRKAAEEEAKVPPKATGKAPEPISVVDKVEDLDKYVKKIIDRELETTIKRVIEEVVRKELGKPLTQLEQGVRDEVQTEVADQARNVERDIKRVAPGAPVAAPAKEEKAAPPPPPPPPAKGASQVINWVRSSKVPVESDLPKPILLDEGVSIQPLMNDPKQGEVIVTDETGQAVNTGIKIELSPGLDPEQQKTLAMGTLEKIIPAMAPEGIYE
jgi:hypothetical protein